LRLSLQQFLIDGVVQPYHIVHHFFGGHCVGVVLGDFMAQVDARDSLLRKAKPVLLPAVGQSNDVGE